MSSLRTIDLRHALDVVDADRINQPGEPMPWAFLEGIAELVDADGVSYLEQDPYAQRGLHDQDTVSGASEGGSADEAWFWSLYWDSPCSYPQRSGDLETVLSPLDLTSARQWRQHPMEEFMRHHGVHDELVVSLTPDGTLDRRLMIWRGDGPAFGERERLLLALLRPHLVAVHLQILSRHGHGDPQVLTPRQRQLLQLVAAGFSNMQIAHRVGISEGTVRKHLENAYARLGVTNRVAAVAHAFPLTFSA